MNPKPIPKILLLLCIVLLASQPASKAGAA